MYFVSLTPPGQLGPEGGFGQTASTDSIVVAETKRKLLLEEVFPFFAIALGIPAFMVIIDRSNKQHALLRKKR